MAAWWQSLSALDHVLLYIAVPATLILLIQTVLLFAGGAFDSDGDAGVPDADGPDFDGHLVDYDDAMRRGVMYRSFETAAREVEAGRVASEGRDCGGAAAAASAEGERKGA